MGEPPFRSRQIIRWLWSRRISDFELMTDISKSLRARLGQIFRVDLPVIAHSAVSIDGTIKFLLSLSGGRLIESVLIPSGSQYTQCLSVQVGCSMGCRFCSTGEMGFTRNLTSGEIAGQVLAARRYLDQSHDQLPVSNLVLMGMGEPLLNWPEVKKALGIIRDKDALNFSRRKVTLSTVGIKKTLLEFGRSRLALAAVSLHAPSQELRKRIMPLAARYELEDLIADLQEYPLDPRERITIEYVMLSGINDSPGHARDLIRLLSGVKCKINLIKFNPGPDSAFESSDQQTIEAFQDRLRSKGLTVMLRKSMGADIHAACGQLRAGFDADKP